MNYGREVLEKYGWREGKGLGKCESGIVEPLKPKLKFDTTGIGHDHSEQFTFNWWEHAFNKAASRIAVNISGAEGTSLNSSDSEEFMLSTKRPWIAKLKKENSLKYGSFVKTETLTNEGKLIPVENKPTVYIDELVSINPLTTSLSDDELFRICGGRTAHKAARHGHKLVGKLARVNEQEKLQTDENLPEESFVGGKTIVRGNGANELSHNNGKRSKKRKRPVNVERALEDTTLESENVADFTTEINDKTIHSKDHSTNSELGNSHKTCKPKKKEWNSQVGKPSCSKTEKGKKSN